MSKKILGLFLSLLLTFSAFAQNSEFHKLRAQIKSDLKLLQNKTLVPSDERDSDFDTDAHCNKIAQILTKLLLLEESRAPLDLSDFEYNDMAMLELSAQTDNAHNIRIYNFGYDCGGSRGWITQPVIQWTNTDGELFAYNFAKKINCQFTKIHALSNGFYLLLGDEKGSGACRERTAYVIRFNGNYLLLDERVFHNSSHLTFCNVSFAFNDKTKELTCSAELEDFSDGKESRDRSAFNLQYQYPDEAERNEMYSLLSINCDTGEFKLKFKNGKFRKTRKNNGNSFFGVYEE